MTSLWFNEKCRWNICPEKPFRAIRGTSHSLSPLTFPCVMTVFKILLWNLNLQLRELCDWLGIG